MEKFYITTAIDYVTGKPHLGHAFEKIVADSIARYHKLAGFGVYFVTGTDEHGERIPKLAHEKGQDVQHFVNSMSIHFQGLCNKLSIDHSKFIRTTDESHKKFVQTILQKIYDAGDIYFGEYEGLYSLGSERYVTEKDLVDGKVPGDKDPPEWRKEANYFFKMEKYQPWLIEFLGNNPDLIQPAAYRNEILEMLREPIGDLSISRSVERVPWGIPIPWDEKHVTYVWFDALFSYVSALGELNSEKIAEFWPKTWHVIGKDILKTHTVFWLTMLKAAGLPNYQRLAVHGHILAPDGRKMGKSLGNALDPLELADKYGVDALRFALLRETSFQSDSPFSEEILINRLNSDLANDLGNLLSRTISMIDKYCAGIIQKPSELTAREEQIRANALALSNKVFEEIRSLRLHLAIENVFEFVRDLNRYIAGSKPWELAKQNSNYLQTVLYTLVEGLRFSSILLEPIMPNKMIELRKQLNLDNNAGLDWGLTPDGLKIGQSEILFPKIEPKKVEEKPKNEILIDDFAKMELRIAEIIHCEAVPKADKLLKLTVQLGTETRTVVSGIANWYKPTDLVGKKVVLVANLKPVKLRGIVSEGMILAAEDESGNLSLISPEKDLPSGSQVR